MQLTSQSQAVMLLTVTFAKSQGDGLKPLSNSEWGRFAFWLRDHGLSPEELLVGDVQSMLRDMNDNKLPVERIQSLLRRGAALGLSLEKWERAGLWAITRADEEYPERIKRRLRALSPPVLFGCGNKALLNRGGLAAVGSRNASEADLSFARDIGQRTAVSGLSIVSGGARGVDQSVMEGALDADGTGVAILANNLMRASSSAAYRAPIRRGDLVLISPFNPEAGFSVGNAMGRNKYLYCLADAAVVISSTPKKGGTWSGATEALKRNWVPVWVKPKPPNGSGNSDLVDLGARWLPQDIASVQSLMADHEGGAEEQAAAQRNAVKETSESMLAMEAKIEGESNDPYEEFISELRRITNDGALKEIAVVEQLEREKKDVKKWLKRGVEERKISKLFRPVRYEVASEQSFQPSLFSDGLE